MFKKLFSVCAALLAAAAALPAAQVLVKPIQRSGWSFYSEMDKTWDGWPAFTGVPADDNLSDVNSRRPRSRAPGFRTASSGSHVFTVGFANPATINDDGFIAKLDPAGSVIWTRTFSEIMGSSGYCPMDVKVMGDRVYVCGMHDEASFQRGFVAKLTLDGSLDDYSVFQPSGTSAFSRATSLAVSSFGGSPSIVVAGDAKGDLLTVKQRQRLAPADVYSGLRLYKDGSTARSDAFIVRLDANLSATWATTMGFPRGDDYANAVTADNDGNIYLALNFPPNVDYEGGNSRIHQVDDHGGSGRPVYSGSSVANLTELADGITDVDIHFDFHPGYWGMLMKIDSQAGTGARIRRLFLPCRNEGGEGGSGNHISDLAYYDGSVYVAGEWRRRLRPQMERHDYAFYFESLPSSAQGYDAYVARLDASTLNADAWRFFQSNGEDFIHEMTVDAGGVYIAGTAGGSLDSLKHYGGDNAQLIDRNNASAEKVTLGGSASYHLFWQKLNLGTLNLAPNSHLTPVEDAGANISIPTGQRNAGIAIAGDTAVFVGGRESGDVTFGPSGERKTLPSTGWSAFAGYLKASDFTFLKEVTVTINSAYGNPLPHRGVDTVAAGQTITASVPPEIHEDASGAIIDPQNTEGIRTGAVTRRVCTGYQFRNSPVNGTANTVTFVATADTELTFLWRTEHAVEVASDLTGTDGLTSTAAGNPEPAVQKHWIRENEQFTAFVDGAESDIAAPGVRWRCTGFRAEGCAAAAQGVTSGSIIRWGYQPRQQTAKITVGSPGRIVWLWQKEFSVRVAVNSSVASGAPVTYSDRPEPSSVFWPLDGRNYYRYDFWGYAPAMRGVLLKSGAAAAPAGKIRVQYWDASTWVTVATLDVAAMGPGQVQRVSFANPDSFSPYWSFTVLDSSGTEAPVSRYSMIEVDRVGFQAGVIAGQSNGTGEFWYAPGSTVTAYAPASVSSGISALSLKGYTGGLGSVVPYDTRSVTSKTFTINQPSSITWDYARAIYPERVFIGQPVTFSGVTGVDATNVNRAKAPFAGNVQTAPSGSGFNDMMTWDAVSGKALVLRPGKFTVEFENKAAASDPAQNVIVEVTALWPVPDYTHILETPAVELDPSAADGTKFLQVAYTEGAGSVNGSLFSTTEPGRSVLLYSSRAGGAATGNLQQESLRVKVVESLRWLDATSPRTPAVIGTAITSADHDTAGTGHNGYVLTDLAPVNASAYDRSTLTGPIIPINEEYPAAGRWATAERADINQGLRVSFPFNESAGRSALDLVSGTQASLNSLYVTYWSNPGYFFWRSGNDHFRADSNDVGSGITNRLTLAVWIKPEQLQNWAGIIVKGIDQAPYTLNTWSDGRIVFGANDQNPSGGSGGGNWWSTGSVPADQWSHVAVTYDGSFIRFYLNGMLDSQHAAAITFGTVDQPLVIAADLPGVDEYFRGWIRDVRIYDRPLGGGQIGSLAGLSPVQNGALPVAWYRVQDGIKWPWKADTYAPQWPASPGRIVTASRLGSEGLKAPGAANPAGWITWSGVLSATSPQWNRPTLDRAGIRTESSRYLSVPVTSAGPSFPLWLLGSAAVPTEVFIYEGIADPSRPLENLRHTTSLNGNWTYAMSLPAGVVHTIIFSLTSPYTANAGVNFDIQGGGIVYSLPQTYSTPAFSDPIIYHQPEPEALGYNPNEEHSLIAPSFLDPARPAAFALRSDLNRITSDEDFTSRPYTLVQFTDKTDPASPVVKMAVYSIADEDNTITDPRLPAFNQKYTYLYQGEAGQRLLPPYPLDVVIGPSTWPEETNAENVDGRIAYHEDKKNNAWIVSGDTDTAEDIRAELFYPVRADFWHPTLETGAAIPLGHLPGTSPVRDILYNTVWPADVAVLKAGETLTFSGGEYASDNSSATPRPKGLPGAVAWQSGKQLFDSANPTMAAAQTSSSYMARVFPALSKREVALPFLSVPGSLQPASGNIIVEGLIWRFKQLPASLQKRLYYDASSQKLGFRGYLNDKTLGDGDLLAAPGAQTVLQPNVITEADADLISALSDSVTWRTAVSQLATLSRSPLGTTATASYPIGLEPASGGALPATVFGPGLAVITNPGLHYSGSASTLPDGYITIAENDDESLGDAPVAIHVLKVTRQKYRGSIAVLRPENVFDEKLTLRHTADFGGDARNLYFEWYYREEDGRDLNPPNISLPTDGTPTGADWTVFGSGTGLNEIQLSGASPATLTDNVFYVRYRHKDDTDNWSAWGGAANSREPNAASPSASVDIAYVAQLAPGWIKRVTDGVNLFDARIRDFRTNNSPATYTSMIQQAGQRWEGPVAFNPQKDAIENFGLIELYQTVLDRGMDLSIDLSPGTNGVNTALLNAANRIAGLYTLMGNEAMADAADPTVGFSTVSGQFGRLSPVLHSFRNQTGNLLQEELALLRGRSEVGARPAYNRLLWNFTNGEGEAAYVMNYGITDLNNDGFLSDVDARRLFPQGHGDAWGHYTMAMKGYYDLAVLNNFTWISRSEKYLIDGIVLDVDYLDERAFAKTAAARAQCGAQLVDLVYRQAYTENPNGQWQGYRDTNTDRAWGVFETAQRTGTAALCDWLTANALLKGEETDTSKTGIRKVDRTTVGELSLIAAQAAAIQSKLDSADRGMNPAGLDPDVVPFDIDPVLTDRTNVNAATHFEQIYSRAVGSNRNALLAFDHASAAGLQVRRTAASTEALRKQAQDQDLAYRNRLIEYFGTPYEGMIGAGKAYPEGYSGPDLYLFLYMDQVSAGGDLLPELDDDIVPTTIVPGLRNLATDTNPFLAGATGVDGLLKDTISTYFPADVQLPSAAGATVTLNLPRRASGYALTAPAEWGQRRSPGAIQAALQQLVQAEWKLRMAVDAYEGTSDDFKLLLRKFEIKSGIASEKIRLAAYAEDRQDVFHIAASAAFSAGAVAEQTRDFLGSIEDTVIEGMPKVVGLASDATAPARALIKGGASAADVVLRIISTASQIAQYRLELEAEEAMVEMEQALLTEDLRSELVDILTEIQQLANDEGDLRMAVIDALESMRAASDRVRTVTQEGLAIIDERTVFNQRVASTTTQQRYEDYTFRVTHTEALRKYQSSFDLAARSAYLAGKAYAYELNLPDNHAANATPLLAEMLRTRTLGEWDGTSPVIGQGGIAEQLAMLKTNFDTLKGQLGFNNPATEVNSFSVRAELGRIGLSARVNADWRTKLETYRIPDLWNYQYENNGVNYGYVFRRYCRPFAPEAAGAQPALVIPFDSSIAAGKNWFGKTLAGGDSSFNASNFSTKIRSAGIRFDGYNNTAMSQTPQVYLVPVGMDRMFLPDSTTLADRAWNVVDQRIPVPLPISPANLADPNWQPFTGSASGFFEEVRKFSSFRAYHDAGGYSASEMLSTGRLVGRSVWNTQWVLIIPSATLLYDAANPSAGIDTLIYGAPLPGFTQANAGTTNRDLIGARDIRILLQTYSISGN